MKRDAIDMFKGVVLLIVTSVLVMAYTTIEKSVSATVKKSQAVVPGVTPVAINLIDKSKEIKPAQKANKSDYVMIRYRWQGLRSTDKNISTGRYTLLLL